VAADCVWPGPGARGRQLSGGPMRPAGLEQGDWNRENLQPTHCGRSRIRLGRHKAVIGKVEGFQLRLIVIPVPFRYTLRP